jgi:hypothetical protein
VFPPRDQLTTPAQTPLVMIRRRFIRFERLVHQPRRKTQQQHRVPQPRRTTQRQPGQTPLPRAIAPGRVAFPPRDQLTPPAQTPLVMIRRRFIRFAISCAANRIATSPAESGALLSRHCWIPCPLSWRAVRQASPKLIPRTGIPPIDYPRRAPRRLHNVYVAVSAFLFPTDQTNAQQVDCRLDSLFGDTPSIFAPDSHRKADSSDGPSPSLAIHFAWDFLHPRDSAKLPEVSIMWTPYARLRRDSQPMSIGTLQHVRPAPVSPPVPISRNRAHITAAALLRFDFHYAHLIRWLGGEYTDAHRDWDSSFAIADTIADVPIPAGLPSVDMQPYCASISTTRTS